MLNYLLVLQGFEDVKDDENKTACPGNCNDLPPSALPVFGALNDAWQIQELLTTSQQDLEMPLSSSQLFVVIRLSPVSLLPCI